MALEGSRTQFFFNELSARVQASSKSHGRERIDDMIDAVATMMDGNPAWFFVVGEPNLWTIELSPGFTVSDWIHQSDCDRRTLLLSIASKESLPRDASEALANRFQLSEYFLSQGSRGASVRGMEARGFGAAVLFEGIGVSLRSEDRWSQTQVSLQHMWLDEDCMERNDEVEALNLSASTQASHLLELQRKRIRSDLKGDPARLFGRKLEVFPHLVFGLDVDSHVQLLPQGVLRVAVGKLMTLDGAVRARRSNEEATFPFMPKCHAESEPTMQKYGCQRRFKNAEGGFATYQYHAMIGSDHRIHLRVCHHPRRIEIGYIGRHLDTVRFN